MTQLLGNIKEWGHTNQKAQMDTQAQHRPRLNTQKTLGPTGLYELVLVAVHMENDTSNVQPKCQGPLQLLSPPFLMTSTTTTAEPIGHRYTPCLKKKVSPV